VRDARRGLVCPHRTSAGGARPRYVVECFFFFSPELSCRRTQPHLVPSGERLGSTRKFIHFWFYFGSGCSPGCMGGDLLSLCRVRRDTAFACDLIMHKHTTSATCLPCVYVHPPCILPGGAGERECFGRFFKLLQTRLARRPGCSSNQPLCDSYPTEDRTQVRLVLLVRVGGGVGVGLRELLLRQLGGTRGGRHPFREHL
jgi:hypothetical protein